MRSIVFAIAGVMCGWATMAVILTRRDLDVRAAASEVPRIQEVWSDGHGAGSMLLLRVAATGECVLYWREAMVRLDPAACQ